MGKNSPVVGVDLGGTNMQIGVVAPDGAIIGRAKRKTKADDGRDAVISRIAAGIEEACVDAKITPADLGGVGIGAPGTIEPKEGVVEFAANLRWDNVPLADLLSAPLGVPVVVDNDVNAAVYGEYRRGAGRGVEDLFGLWIGTGIGGGIILGGRIYYGHFLSAGEIGHTILFPGNPPGMRKLEHICSRTAVVERLVRLIRGNRKSLIVDLVGGDLTDIKSKVVAEAYKRGDALTCEVVDSAADLLGVAVANVVTVLAVPRVVLGGGLTEAIGKPLVERVARSVREHVFPDECRRVEIVATQLLDDAGVVGAAMIARERLAK
jgi:glucokinase